LCHHRFQRLDIQRLLGDDVFQAAVLVLELLQPLHLAQLHAAVLGFPTVVGLLGDPIRATQVSDRPAGFPFLDDRQDLLAHVLPSMGQAAAATLDGVLFGS
jgi:hypothetical protein